MSFRRLISSRANGALSRGPKSIEGLQRSSQNALRHGILSQNTVLDNEDQEAFAELFKQYTESFDPQSPVEFDMIEELSSAYWRMRRLWAVETRLMNEQLGQQTGEDELSRITQSFSNLADTNKFQVLNRYEARLQRTYQRVLQNLLLLQSLKPILPNEPT